MPKGQERSSQTHSLRGPSATPFTSCAKGPLQNAPIARLEITEVQGCSGRLGSRGCAADLRAGCYLRHEPSCPTQTFRNPNPPANPTSPSTRFFPSTSRAIRAPIVLWEAHPRFVPRIVGVCRQVGAISRDADPCTAFDADACGKRMPDVYGATRYCRPSPRNRVVSTRRKR